MPSDTEEIAERYSKILNWRNAIFAITFGINVAFCSSTPSTASAFAVTIIASAILATIALVSFSTITYYANTKFKQATARTRDYAKINLVVYPLFILLPILTSVILQAISGSTNITFLIVMLDLAVITLFAVAALIPRKTLFGGKTSPITDSNIINRIKKIAEKIGVPIYSLYTVCWKKFKIANAVQVGPQKFSIYISDYLIENFSSIELEAVAAHELAHAKKKHVLKINILLILGLILGLDLLFFSYSLEPLPFKLATMVAGFLCIFALLSFLFPFIQRRFETEADTIAVETIGNGEDLISALNKLGELNLTPKQPPFDRWALTHPTFDNRVKNIQRIIENIQNQAAN